MSVGERIFQLRGCLKLSQKEFGERMGLSQNTIFRLESGMLFAKKYVKLICGEFEVNEQWLLDGKGSVFKIEKQKCEISEILDQLSDEYKGLASQLLKEMLNYQTSTSEKDNV